jgi:uncharacterized protein YdaU (DUF1376 family)
VSARWYKRCGADFIHGTMMLTLEEKGAYSLCLDLIYDRGGPIPDDNRWLAGVCGVSLRKWTAIRDRLISLGKLIEIDGLISNSRAALELVSSELQARKLAESGSKGGRKRAENAGQLNKSNDLAEASLKLTREEKSRVEEIETNVSIRTRTSASLFCRPDWADPQHWDDFLLNRKRKRLTNSRTAYAGFIRDIEKHTNAQWPPGRLLEYAAAKGWGSINEPEDQSHGHANRGNHGRMGGPRPDPTLALVRAATAAQRQDDGDYWQARAALPPG